MFERLMFWRKKSLPPPPIKSMRCHRCKVEVTAWHSYETGQVLCAYCAARYK
jgi:hypothetical protein